MIKEFVCDLGPDLDLISKRSRTRYIVISGGSPSIVYGVFDVRLLAEECLRFHIGHDKNLSIDEYTEP